MVLWYINKKILKIHSIAVVAVCVLFGILNFVSSAFLIGGITIGAGVALTYFAKFSALAAVMGLSVVAGVAGAGLTTFANSAASKLYFLYH